MEKLELKHVSPYLPYKLLCKMCSIVDEIGEDLEILSGIQYNGLALLGSGGRFGFIQRSFTDIKPILHPLSDLTKEIEVNGEKFVPLDWYDKNYSPLNCSHNEMQEHFMKDTLRVMPYLVIEKLFEWHFDVFGLINKGLAIDIKSIEKL